MSIKSMLAKIPNAVNAIQGDTPLIRNGVRAEKYFNREGFAFILLDFICLIFPSFEIS